MRGILHGRVVVGFVAVVALLAYAGVAAYGGLAELAGATLLLAAGGLLYAVQRRVRVRTRTGERAALERANAELSKAQGSLMLAFDQIAYRFDAATTRIQWSGAHAKLLGYSQAQMGDDEAAWLARVHPDERQRVQQELERVHRGGAMFQLEYRYLHADGGWRWMNDRGVPHFDAAGTLREISGVMRDVSAQKRLEADLAEEQERYRAAFEHAAMGIAHVALDGTITQVNQRMCDMLDIARPNLLGTRFADLLDGGASGSELLEDEAATRETERRFRRGDGASFWGLLTVSLIPGAPGRAGDCVCMVQDIADRKRAEALTERARHSLSVFARQLNEAVEQERARISREVHDELGQALTSLKMDLGWFKRRLAEHDLEPAGMLRRRLDIMGRLIDETLDTVRRIATELRPALLDDVGLAAALEAQVGQIAGRSDLRVELSLAPGVQPAVEQTTGLYRIAQEALTNVARHAEASHVRVTLTTVNDTVVMEIEDDGHGFDVEDASKSHLGLLGIAERARLLGGQAQIVSAPNRGTLVRVAVPYVEHAGVRTGAEA